MKTIVPGMLVELLSCPNPICDAHRGEFHIVGSACLSYPGSWFMDPMMIAEDGRPMSWASDHLRPITPPPGVVSEQEVKELFQPSPKKETVE